MLHLKGDNWKWPKELSDHPRNTWKRLWRPKQISDSKFFPLPVWLWSAISPLFTNRFWWNQRRWIENRIAHLFEENNFFEISRHLAAILKKSQNYAKTGATRLFRCKMVQKTFVVLWLITKNRYFKSYSKSVNFSATLRDTLKLTETHVVGCLWIRLDPGISKITMKTTAGMVVVKLFSINEFFFSDLDIFFLEKLKRPSLSLNLSFLDVKWCKKHFLFLEMYQKVDSLREIFT